MPIQRIKYRKVEELSFAQVGCACCRKVIKGKGNSTLLCNGSEGPNSQRQDGGYYSGLIQHSIPSRSRGKREQHVSGQSSEARVAGVDEYHSVDHDGAGSI